MKKNNSLYGSTVLITGGTGSWGNQLTSQLLANYNPKEIRIFSRGEHKQVEMKRKFKNDLIKYFIGDVRDLERLKLVSRNVDYIFHLAALKHVHVCEDNPWEAVQTNIVGTQNIIESAIENKVRKVVDVSTDKAVDPFNLYGVTKACGEKLIIAANNISPDTSFVCIRGGNVLGTNGSVIPLFKEQISKNNEITITNSEMTRFFMKVEEAIGLVLDAATHSIGGEIMVMKMPAAKIVDLAQTIIRRLGNKKTTMRQIGIRPGEKLYEVLVSKYETPRTYEFGKYYLILPQIHIPKTEKYYSQKNPKKIKLDEYTSINTAQLSHNAIEKLLESDGWFTNNGEKEATKYLKSLSSVDLANFVKNENWIKRNML